MNTPKSCRSHSFSTLRHTRQDVCLEVCAPCRGSTALDVGNSVLGRVSLQQGLRSVLTTTRHPKEERITSIGKTEVAVTGTAVTSLGSKEK